MARTVFALTSTDTSDDGKLTRQFLSDWCKTTSAWTTLPAGFFGGIAGGESVNGEWREQNDGCYILASPSASLSLPASRGRRRPWAQGGGSRQNQRDAGPCRRGWTRPKPATRPAQPRFCHSLPAAIVSEISPITPDLRPSFLYSGRHLSISPPMALLTTSAPVNYNEQEGVYLYTRSQHPGRPLLTPHSCLC